MKNSAASFLKDESGATAVEYGLILTGIAVVVVTAVSTLSGSMNSLFTTIAGKLSVS